MGWGPEHVCGRDLDDLLAYNTAVVVSIKDRRLGCLNFFFMVSAAAYVLLYQMLYGNSYLEVTAPSGGFRFSLREETNELGCDPVSDVGCFPVLPDLDEVAYCNASASVEASCYTASDGSGSGSGSDESERCLKQRPCIVLDDLDVGVLDGTEFLLTTRVLQVAQRNVCLSDQASCTALWENVEGISSDAYVAALENFTLLIDHAVEESGSGASDRLGGVARAMKGQLSVPLNHALCEKFAAQGRTVLDAATGGQPTSGAPCWVDSSSAAADGHDVFTVEEWLAAGDLQLDAWSGDPNYEDEPVRGRGHVLVLTIDYTNIQPWRGASNDISYTYSVQHLAGSSFKLTSSTDVLDANSSNVLFRRVEKRYGVKIIVLQVGKLGRFSFNTLLLQIAAGSALLGIAALLTDFLALHVLPQKEEYMKAKVKQTDDFSDLRAKHREKRTRMRARSSEEAASRSSGSGSEPPGQAVPTAPAATNSLHTISTA